jgi:hypothetical protein
LKSINPNIEGEVRRDCFCKLQLATPSKKDIYAVWLAKVLSVWSIIYAESDGLRLERLTAAFVWDEDGDGEEKKFKETPAAGYLFKPERCI